MIIKKISRLVVICFCSIFFISQLVSAQESEFVQLLSIAESPKLADSKGLLAPFYDGQEYIKVIVSLVHSPEAEALSQQSRASSPATLNQPPGTLYFDLQDERVKSQLRDTVGRKIDSVVSSFVTENIEVTRKYTYVFGFSATVNIEGLQQLIEMKGVVDVSEDFVLEAHTAQGIPLMSATIPRSNYNGAGMSIAICDTGIDTAHPRLGNGGSPIFNSKVIGGYDTGDLDGDPRPSINGDPHGTACAGISAGNLGTVGDYIGGVAPGSKLYAIKISSGDTGGASSAAMIAGWEWSVTHKNDDPANPIMIISTSFGGGRFFGTCDTASTAMTQAAANAIAAGITIFASSGNDGYCDSMAWPACISSVNAVGAVYDANIGTYLPCVNENSCASKQETTGCSTGWYATDSTAPDKVASYSNSASSLALFGPANAAYTADIVGAGGYSGGDYTTSFGGTSAACPYVAGAAAVLQSAARSLTGLYLTPAEVKLYLTLYGNNLTDGKVNITAPRVNVAASVSHLSGPTPPGDNDFQWGLYYAILSSMTTGVLPPPPPPAAISQWGVINSVCCGEYSTTFSVTLQPSGLQKSSTTANCSAEPTFSGYSNTSIGPKSLTWNLAASACGSLNGSFSLTFENNNRYLVAMELDGGSLVVKVYYGPIPTNQTNSSDDSLSSSYGSLNSLTLHKRIVIPLAGNSDGANSFQQCSSGR